MRAIDRRVAVELQWDLDGDDPDCEWFLGLYVVIERPSDVHARYDCVELGVKFPTETQPQRDDAVASACELAARVELPVRYPDITTRGGWGGSTWIRDQPEARAVYEVSWEVRWWTDDGVVMTASGVGTHEASSGNDAEMLVSRDLLERFPRPLQSWVWRDTKGSSSISGVPYPASFPDMLTVRRRALDLDARASAVARMLIARVPAATALQVMVVFEDSFYCRLENLDALARWKRGEIDDAALDAALRFGEWRDDWGRAIRLQDAFAAGRSVAALLRDDHETSNMVHLHRSLREAFPIAFNAAKLFVDDCRDARRDRELDAQIRALFPGAKRP